MKKKYEFVDSMHQNYPDYYGYVYLTIDMKHNLKYVGQRKGHTYYSRNINYFGSGVRIKEIINSRGTFFLKKIILGVCYSPEELLECETECKLFFNVLNPLYGYNYIKDDSCPMKGKIKELNPRYQISNYDIWIEKYGKEVADKKREDRINKYISTMAGRTEDEKQKRNKNISLALNSREEAEKFISIQQGLKTRNSRSIEDRIESERKRKNTFNNKSEEEKLKIYLSISNKKRNMTEEQKKVRTEKFLLSLANKTEEERQARIDKRLEKMNKRSNEEKQLSIEKFKKTMSNKSEIEKQARINKRKETMNKKTTEEKKDIHRRISETKRKKKELKLLTVEKENE